MDYRLTLEERNQIASELRATILTREDPRRLQSLEDESIAPNPSNKQRYAFEFFLDRYRDRVRKGSHDFIEYYIGWAGASVERDEETQSFDRLLRMTTESMMDEMLRKGQIEALTVMLGTSDFAFAGIIDTRIRSFLYEVLYELFREIVRVRIEQLYARKKA